MNKNVLYIPRPGDDFRMIRNGYVDALKHFGFKVYVVDPVTKLACMNFINEHDISIIFTHSKYGLRQLPIDVINKNNIYVIACMLPCNTRNNTLDGKYEYTPTDELQIIDSIDRCVQWTYIEQHAHGRLMNLCKRERLKTVPLAGNIFRAEPDRYHITTDASIYDYSTDKNILSAVSSHCDLIGLDYQLFGDVLLRKFNDKYCCRLPEIENAIASNNISSRVNVNLHDSRPAFLSDQTFMIPMCGGFQVINSEIARKYLGDECRIQITTKDIIDAILDDTDHTDYIIRQAEIASKKHSYLNRLVDIFTYVGVPTDGMEADIERVATRHIWTIESNLRNRRMYESYINGA